VNYRQSHEKDSIHLVKYPTVLLHCLDDRRNLEKRFGLGTATPFSHKKSKEARGDSR
jgi:hypothetical protein